MRISRKSPSSNIQASEIKFSPRNAYGIKMYFPDRNRYPDAVTESGRGKFSVLYDEDEKRYFIRIWVDERNGWSYPTWSDAHGGFPSLSAASDWLSKHDWKNADKDHIERDEDTVSKVKSEYLEAMDMLGFERSTSQFFNDSDTVYEYEEYKSDNILDGYITIRSILFEDGITVITWLSGKRTHSFDAPSVSKMIRHIEFVLNKYGYGKNSIKLGYTLPESRKAIMAAINTRDMMKNIVRVKSSNVWGYCINIKEHGDRVGDVLCQFKGVNGGGGDVYIYYDVPVVLYRRWVGAQSKGHFHWQYIRHNFKYSKLTGDKRGRLPNAVN